MAYDKREFIQKATIHIGAAMLSETNAYIIDNFDAQKTVAQNAVLFTVELADMLENYYKNVTGKKVFDDEL